MSDAQLAARVRRLVAERRSARDAAAAEQGIDGPTDMEEDGVEVDVDVPDAQLGARVREFLARKRSSNSSKLHIIGKVGKTRRGSI